MFGCPQQGYQSDVDGAQELVATELRGSKTMKHSGGEFGFVGSHRTELVTSKEVDKMVLLEMRHCWFTLAQHGVHALYPHMYLFLLPRKSRHASI